MVDDDGIPWQWSARLQKHYIYRSTTDELVFEDGDRRKRPDNLDPEDLERARYNGRLPEPDYTQSPDTERAYPHHSRGESSRPGPAYGSAATPRTTTRSPDYSAADTTNELTSRMQRMGVSDMNLVPNPQRRGELLAPVQLDIGGGRLEARDLGQSRIKGAEVAGNLVTERLYPDYKPRKKDFFWVGKIFSILWSEPMGTTPGKETEFTSREEAVVLGPFKEPIFSKIRRFVVIRSGDGYCNALPITTYNGRGVAKRGVIKSEHAIIYTGSQPPRLSPPERAGRDEDPMLPLAIRVDPDTKAEKLDSMSRINFGHPHTIQHNVKVKSCGKVAESSMQDLVAQFRNVFTVNMSQATKSSGSGSSKRGEATAGSDVKKVSAALNAMFDVGMSKEDALPKMIETLLDKGYSRAEAADLIKAALA